LRAPRRYAVGGATAATLLAQLSPSFAAPLVAPADARLKTSYQEFPSPQGYGTVRGYLAMPANAKGKLPAVLVVHENRGLNPHIEDIARRLALEGFIAYAPDALFPLGGYPGDEDKARALFPKLDQAKTRADFIAAAHARWPRCRGGDRQDRRGRLLLWRRHRQLPGHPAARAGGGRALLRQPSRRGRGSGPHPRAADDPRRRQGRAHPGRLAGLRGGAARPTR
jgi:hypothetical protein